MVERNMCNAVMRGNRCVRFVFGVTAATQHSLPGDLLGLTWAGLAPADRASFAGAFPYSITSSASESRLSEILTPSALAALRLTKNSNLDGCRTGRSAGFAPLRICPA
jgi:hypothetical protein